VQPVSFGTSQRQLLGVYFPPEGEAARETGVLLCGPGPQEYMRTHWAVRKLAAQLARRGFPVLRFDYYGTGDSGGETAEGRPSLWVEDVEAAGRELRDVSGAYAVSAVGLRLGATLAARAASAGLELEDLVLWEPVVRGDAYVDELRAIGARWYSEFLFPPDQRPGSGQLLGYAFPSAVEAETRALDLLEPPPRAGRRVVVAVSEERPEYLALRRRLEEEAGRGGTPLHWRLVPEEASEGGDGALLSSRILSAIAEALEAA
jgi:pimeloyl-ACP methyl ester carboxylesterase